VSIGVQQEGKTGVVVGTPFGAAITILQETQQQPDERDGTSVRASRGKGCFDRAALLAIMRVAREDQVEGRFCNGTNV